MTTETITIHNVQTGEIITREMNAQELAQYEADKEANELLKAEAEAKAAQKAAMLDRLGITADEAKLLLS
jgi:predicted GIY-YIG superfamily endonuclease